MATIANAGVDVWTTSGPRAAETDLIGVATDELVVAPGQPGHLVVRLPSRSKKFGTNAWATLAGLPFGSGLTSVGAEGRLLGSTQTQLIESIDGGRSWLPVRDIPPLLYDGEGKKCDGLAVAPSDPNRMIRFGDFTILSFLILPGCLGVSHDGGATFTDLALGPFNAGGRGALRVVFDPLDASIVWLRGAAREIDGVLNSSTFYKSTDGGLSWVAASVNPGSPPWIRIDPADGRRMLVGAPVHYTEDGGVTWVNVSGGLPTVFAADADWAANPPQVYAATSTGIWTAPWKSSSWQRVPGSELLDATDLRVVPPKDTTQRTTIVAATSTGVWEYTLSSGLPFVPVYRFFNTQTGAHFYTASLAERDLVIATYPQFAYEGERFQVLATAAAGTLPVHRFFNSQTSVHFYTADDAEKNHVLATWPQFVYEGIAYHAFRADPGTAPTHRFFNVATGTHFYTSSEDELLTVQQNYPQFVYEGIRWAVYPSSPELPAP
ncbi:MAG: hypothetical protein ABI585_09390 [Betaproteobacteria bacterium]